MRQQLIDALRQHFQAHIAKHKMNVEVMLSNPIAIPEHTDIMDSIEKEIEIISNYHDKLSVLKEYFE